FNNGAYAEFIRIPARIVSRNTYRIPAGVSYQDAALVEPLACVMRGLDETGARPGDSVAVIGLGPIGLMFVRLAKLLGARVIAIGRRVPQLERAAALGADELIAWDESGDPIGKVRRLTGGRGTDVAIEAVGNPETWLCAVEMARRGGVVNFFGGCPQDTVANLDTNRLHYSEITCRSSFHHTPAYIRRSLEAISRGEISAEFFVNREEPLRNLLQVMRHLMSHNGHLKTAIIP
ncbi:MAG: zinc-binding dehydrogenase, partial [Acidobacteria bacterium]|nr:zinc-binding dehydrogenase [Acidobacteriota bacterium]